jgi:hypothetical protein
MHTETHHSSEIHEPAFLFVLAYKPNVYTVAVNDIELGKCHPGVAAIFLMTTIERLFVTFISLL